MAILAVPNETGLKRAIIKTETTPGAFVVPDVPLMLDFSATPGRGALKRSQDATGGYDRTNVTRRDFAEPSGTFGGSGLTYQEMAILGKYALKGGVTGVTDGQSPPAFTYTYTPSFAADDIATFSALFGVDGLPWRASGVRFDEINISGDATSGDDQWQISGTPKLREAKRYEGFEGVSTALTTAKLTLTGAGWTVNQFQGAYVFVNYGTGIGEVRQVASNTATELTFETAIGTPGSQTVPFYIAGLFPTVTQPDYTSIAMEGTAIYLDVYNPSVSALGTTNVSDRVLSFNVTQTLNLAIKRRASGVIGRTGRGAREVSGTLRFEYDRWDEYAKWIADKEISIRIEKIGPVINAAQSTYHKARIDIERAVFDAWTEDSDNNNMTVSLTFLAELETPIWKWVVITDKGTY